MKKPFTTLAVVLLSLIALLQLLRVLLGWEITINQMPVPLWASGVAFAVIAGLAAMVWKESGDEIEANLPPPEPPGQG